MNKWQCLKCDWQGNEAKTKTLSKDVSWKECPECRNYATLRFNPYFNMKGAHRNE